MALNPAYEAPEIEYCLKKVGIKALFVNHKHRAQNYYDILLSIIPELANSTADRRVASQSLDKLKSVVVNDDAHLP